MTELIDKITSTADIGIHPGVESHNAKSSGRMTREIQRLEEVSEAPITRARQHYLLQRYPDSWNRLEEVGILHDYSMGYADLIGFRSGMSRPYKAFDAVANCPLNLTIHPTAAMDATLNRYMGLTPNQALKALEQLLVAERVRVAEARTAAKEQQRKVLRVNCDLDLKRIDRIEKWLEHIYKDTRRTW